MKSGLRIIDADGHTMEPPDLWERYLDPPLRARVRRGERGTLVDGRPTADPDQPARLAALGFSPAKQIERFGDIARNGFDARSVTRALDVEGVDHSVIYGPILDMWLPDIDPRLAAGMARAYNRWLADYSGESGGRILGAAPLPIQDVELAVEELRFAYDELGLRAFWVRPNPVAGRLLGDPCYDPLYAELQERDASLSLHEGAGTTLPSAGHDRFHSHLEWHACCHPMEQQMALLCLISRGALDRFPQLRVALLESGCGWLPFWLHRLDEHAELVGATEAPGLQLRPSEYFRRQCFISCDPDDVLLKQVVETVGDDAIVFATDFPHPDAPYPHAVDRFLSLPGVERESQRKILWDNPLRLYADAIPKG